MNVTVVSPLGLGYVLLYPQGGAEPVVSTLNYLPGETVANAAIVPLGTGGGITVAAAVSGTDLLIDVNGYFGATGAGFFNTFVGAGNSTMTEEYNTAAGHLALFSNATGGSNTAVGLSALRLNDTGSNNTALGAGALELNTGGSDNTATNTGLKSNTSGSANTAVGNGLQSNTTGSYNTAVGGGLYANTTGSGNTMIHSNGAEVEANGNLQISDDGSDDGDTTTVRIGQDGQQNRVWLAGVRSATGLPGAIPVFVDSHNQLGTAPSSRRFKKDVQDMADESRGLFQLRPVTFRYRGQSGGHLQFGLIAEEVDAVLPELVVRGAGGEAESVLYQELPAMLLNEIQEQGRRLEEQRAGILAERARLERQRDAAEETARTIESLERRLSLLERGSSEEEKP